MILDARCAVIIFTLIVDQIIERAGSTTTKFLARGISLLRKVSNIPIMSENEERDLGNMEACGGSAGGDGHCYTVVSGQLVISGKKSFIKFILIRNSLKIALQEK